MNPIGRRTSLGAIAGLVLTGTSAFAAEAPPDAGAQTLLAEFAVGEDGLPRAIRIVR